jgi:capsid protein
MVGQPDVTGEFTRPMLERLLLRSWLRDGEVFTQLVSGNAMGCHPLPGSVSGLKRLRLIMSDAERRSNGLIQGIYKDNWGSPKNTRCTRAALFPADNWIPKMWQRKTCCTLNSPAACIRPEARRFFGVLMRLSALKEYEDSELVAARIAAALGMYIKKVTDRVTVTTP